MTKFEKACMLVKQAHNKVALVKDITVYGYQFNYETTIIGTVNKYWFGNNQIIEKIAPLDKDSGNHNRSGDKKTAIEYVVVHDVGSTAETATAAAHATYVSNGGGGTSWHYSVGDDAIYHQIPDDEVAIHAGDGFSVPFTLSWTGVKATYDEPKVTIQNGFYYINGKKTLIPSPTVGYVKEGDEYYFTSNGVKQNKKLDASKLDEIKNIIIDESKINDYGLYIMTRPDGYYYMGKTYYNGIFGRIANRGGNMNGIGIEMMLNKGSNLSVTYHRTAKLISKLLVDNNLNLSRVRPHHFFSGKNCPETLRMNGLWNDFMDLVKTEYEFALLKYNITLEFICNSDCVDKTGLIIKMPEDKKIEYQVKVTYDDGITKEEEILSFVTVVE